MWEEPCALPVLGLERERERERERDRQGERKIKTDRGGRERKIERETGWEKES